MKKTKKQQNNNYLDYIPIHKTNLRWDETPDELVTIYIENTGIMNRIAQKLLKKPKISQVHLEPYGSFIWRQIDGQRTVQEIAELANSNFGEKIHPLYERLCTYIAYLEQIGFVTIQK